MSTPDDPACRSRPAAHRRNIKALAAAFGTTIEGLQVTEEEIDTLVRAFHDKYKIITMSAPSDSAGLGELVSSTDAFMLQRVGDLSEQQLDALAEFEATLHDYIDIWRSMEVTHRRDGEKTLFADLSSLAVAGIAVTLGHRKDAAQKPSEIGIFLSRSRACSGLSPGAAARRESSASHATQGVIARRHSYSQIVPSGDSLRR